MNQIYTPDNFGIVLIYAHLATVIPAALLGAYLLIARKGDPVHRRLGRVYLILMLATATISLIMPAQVGPRWLGHFGFIHLLSGLVLYSVVDTYRAARRGDIQQHRRTLIGLYVGAILIAGSLAVFMPGRWLHDQLF